jgi:hypothetical protein
MSLVLFNLHSFPPLFKSTFAKNIGYYTNNDVTIIESD